ncbi:hypothetical protein ACFQ0D_12590, partial [Micromonospora zhanjiangensis]
MNVATRDPLVGKSFWRNLGHRWPAAVGLAAAVLQLASGVSRETVAVTLCAALLCYLAAAASNRPWVGWASIAGAVVVVVVGELVGLVWWAAIGLAALVLVVVGLFGPASRPALTRQAAALLGYGAV